MKYILIPKNNKTRSDYSRMFVFRDVAELAEYLESSPYAVKKAFQDGDEINASEKRVMWGTGDGILRLYGDGDEVYAACERFVEKTESTKQTDLF